MRLFLIWYEILMDNATEDCHKMFQSLVPKIGSSENSEFDLFTVKTFRECELSCIHHVTVTLLSTFAATDALSRQLMCILK